MDLTNLADYVVTIVATNALRRAGSLDFPSGAGDGNRTHVCPGGYLVMFENV